MGGCGGQEGWAPSGSQGDKGERSGRKCVVCVGEAFLHQPPWRLPPPPGTELRGQALPSPRSCRSRPTPGLAHLPTWSWHSSLGCLQLVTLSPELPLWRLSLVPPLGTPHSAFTSTDFNYRIPTSLLSWGPGPCRAGHTPENTL